MKWLNKLPDYLNKISLNISSAALKYKFGYYDDEYIKDLKSKEAIDKFMENLYNQPAANELKQNFYYVGDNKNIKLQTKTITFRSGLSNSGTSCSLTSTYCKVPRHDSPYLHAC